MSVTDNVLGHSFGNISTDIDCLLSVENWSEEDAEHGDKDRDGEGGGETADPRQTTFVHIKPVWFSLHKVQELGVKPLTIKVVDGIFKRIFVSLLAHALVAPRSEASALDRNALTMKNVNIQSRFKRLRLTYDVLSSHLWVLLKALGV